MQAVYVDPGAPGKNPPTITALDCGACGNRGITRAMSDSAITFAIVGAVVVLFAWNRIPVALVALGTALSLYFTGVLDLRQALGGLGDSVVIFIASLFVVSAGLETTGVTAWAGQLVVAQAGESRTRLLVLLGLATALLTAVITPTGQWPRSCPWWW